MREGLPDFTPLRGKRLLIALSGGADSVALAAMLAEARPTLGLRLDAAHLDHAIRAESADDAVWCRELCERLDIPFHTARIDVPAEAARSGEGLETAARRVRYAWLRRVKAEVGADCVVLAHHMDDEAETVLMHLARGAGPEGIGGMAEQSGDLARPLLGVRKAALTAWLEARGLCWREDATNAVADTPRNALRLHGIPELEKSYPQFVPAAARYAEAARVESDYVARQAGAFLEANLRQGPFGRLLRLDGDIHPAILRRCLRALCDDALDWKKALELQALAASNRGATEIPGGLRVERGRLGLYFLPARRPAIPEAPLALDGRTLLPGLCAISAAPSEPVAVRDDPLCQVLDADALEGAVVRVRRDGDRLRPMNGGDRLLSDVLTDRKLDRPLRNCVALVTRGNRVLWACGHCVGDEAKLTPATRRAVRLECAYAYTL